MLVHEMTYDVEAQQQAARERYERAYIAQQGKLRRRGIAIMLVGLLLNLVNAFMVIANGRFFVFTLFMGPTMLYLGFWLIAFGRPFDVATGKPAAWGTAGLIGTVVLGAATAIALFAFLKG